MTTPSSNPSLAGSLSQRPLKMFDLRPSPRILPMLGEITMEEWRCIAELVDNPIDAFLAALREGAPVLDPEVRITLPTTTSGSARISVRDNAPGMDVDTLELAARAGWTSNDPINHLGLFGMGFNIATARLGSVTTVWTSRAGDSEWYGLRIDFDELQRQGSFFTGELRRDKADPSEHGTEVVIERLKPQYQDWFVKAANQSAVRKMLGKTYASLLRPNGTPMTFRLYVGPTAVRGYEHCVWGDPNGQRRVTQMASVGPVDSYQEIDRHLPARPYCKRCWQWLPIDGTVCAQCGDGDQVVQRERQVRGWIGIQRYLSRNEYGIDFIRNGRKIEIGNTDLFFWNDGTSREPEYPIDDPRQRGRTVGEIHLDHCRVTYTKDSFDRHDPAWADMVRIVRGEGPLRPDKASQLGFAPNTSSLFRLYQAFRRSTPKQKVAGCWARLLVVPDNDLAEEMAKRFHKGEAEFRTDEKWWALVQEADQRLLTQGPTPTPTPTPVPGTPAGPTIPGFGSGAPPTGGPTTPAPTPAPSPVPAPATPPRVPIASLSREYQEPATQQRWRIQAFEVADNDPDLAGERPWTSRTQPNGVTNFLINSGHAVFRSMTMTALDALLAELACSAMDFQRGAGTDVPFALLLANLRDRYAGPLKLDPVALSNEAAATLNRICQRVGSGLDRADAVALFDEFVQVEQDAIYARMAMRAVRDPQDVIAGGRFLEFAPRRSVLDFYERHPELFLDGRCWDDAYGSLDYGTGAATEEARRQVARYYGCLLNDVVWISEQEPADFEDASRERILRCMLAVDLLAAAIAVEEESV